MEGLLIAYAITGSVSLIFLIIALGWRQELLFYRRNEAMKRLIEEDTAQDGKLLKSGGSVEKY